MEEDGALSLHTVEKSWKLCLLKWVAITAPAMMTTMTDNAITTQSADVVEQHRPLLEVLQKE
jgi:hypothetical protein